MHALLGRLFIVYTAVRFLVFFAIIIIIIIIIIILLLLLYVNRVVHQYNTIGDIMPYIWDAQHRTTTALFLCSVGRAVTFVIILIVVCAKSVGMLTTPRMHHYHHQPPV